MKAIPPPAASPTSSTVSGGGLIAVEICGSLSPSERSRAVVATLLLLWMAARIYDRVVLRMGAPLKLRQAFRYVRRAPEG